VGSIAIATSFVGAFAWNRYENNTRTRSGIIPDCIENKRSLFFPETSINEPWAFIAKITVIKAISRNEREHVLLGDFVDNEKNSLLAHVDQTLRGNIPASEIEVSPLSVCVDPEQLKPGASGLVVGNQIYDSRKTWTAGHTEQFWRLAAETKSTPR
jgi:hypothetical protein